MRRRALAVLTVFSLALGAVVPTTVAAGGATSHFKKISVANVDPQVLPFLLDKSRQLDLMVELSTEPVAALVGNATDSGTTATTSQRDAWRSQIKANQTPVVDAVRQHGVATRAAKRHHAAFDFVRLGGRMPTTAFTSTSRRRPLRPSRPFRALAASIWCPHTSRP